MVRRDIIHVDGRPRCNVPGCTTLAMLKDHRSGKPRYRLRCTKHQRALRLSNTLETNTCERCGWRGECQRHRIIPGSQGGVYTRANVLILCPNCHVAAHGRGDWNCPQQPTGAINGG